MKVGAKRDYDLTLAEGTAPTGEVGLLMSISRDEEFLLVFLGKREIDVLRSQLADALFDREVSA